MTAHYIHMTYHLYFAPRAGANKAAKLPRMAGVAAIAVPKQCMKVETTVVLPKLMEVGDAN
jgi:hypothetical protein